MQIENNKKKEVKVNVKKEFSKKILYMMRGLVVVLIIFSNKRDIIKLIIVNKRVNVRRE